MGRRGPPGVPTKLKILRGNPGRQKLNHREPEPRPDAPECPDWLDEVAQAKWREVLPELHGMGVLCFVDGDALTNYCQAWSRWRKAEEFIQKHGSVFTAKNPNGSIRFVQPVPQVGIARNLYQVLNRYQRELGLTPSARTLIHTERSADKGDDLDRFLTVHRA